MTNYPELSEEQILEAGAEVPEEGQIEDTGNEQVAQDGQEASKPAEAAASAYAFNPQNYPYKYKGQVLYPKDPNHLTALLNKGHGYDQAMAEINKQRQQFEQESQSLAKYKQMEEILSQNPEVARIIEQQIRSIQGGEQQEVNPEVQTLKQELEELKSWKEELSKKESINAVNKEIQDLKSKYPDVDWDKNDGEGTYLDQVIQFGIDNDILNVEHAYKVFNHDNNMLNSKHQGLQQAAKEVEKNHKKGIVNTDVGSIPKISEPVNHRGKSYDQIADAILGSGELNF